MIPAEPLWLYAIGQVVAVTLVAGAVLLVRVVSDAARLFHTAGLARVRGRS